MGMSANESETKVFFYLCMGIVFGIVGFFQGFKIRSKRKLIENIPTSTVRGMAVGLVELQGTGEGRAFSRAEATALMDLGLSGCDALMAAQWKALG